MFEKHLWKSDILSKDPGHRPKSLLKMSLFHRCFSNILLVKTNHLVYPYVEHWSEMGWSKPLTKWFPVLLRMVHGMHPRDDNLSSHKMYILRHGKLSPLPLERIHTSWKTDLFVDFSCWNREKKQTRSLKMSLWHIYVPWVPPHVYNDVYIRLLEFKGLIYFYF